MRVELSPVICLLLVLISAKGADGEDQGSCPSQPGEEGGSAELEEATSSGSIHAAPYRLHQFFKEECQTEEARAYRTADGSCNHMFNLGSANTPFKRHLPPAYWDSVSWPRTHGRDGHPLATATDVSRTVLFHRHSTTRRLTVMYMTWGQFVDHDMDLTPVSMQSGEKIKCCGVNGTFPDYKMHPQCFPIQLGPEDARKRFRGDCMQFVRSLPARDLYGHLKVPREQINSVTAFIDGSMIYGSSDELQRQLREIKDGELSARLNMSEDGLLPKDSSVKNCIIPEGKEDKIHCFLAGDTRVNVQPGLIAMHTIWVRLHNVIVEELRKLERYDTEEELFQEARKIAIAILQNIHYKEFVPLVIGEKMQERYMLKPANGSGNRIGYSAYTDPRVTCSFATAAFRFGHSNIPEHLRVGKNILRFQDLFFRPALIFQKFDGVVKSLLRTKDEDLSEDGDRFLVKDVSDHLFEPADQVKNAPSQGFDLAALNIQRGRDHGLPPYNKYRELCGLPPIKNFTEFGDEAAKNLRSVYRSVADIDLFVGGLLETPEDGADVGPTFAYIIAMQFHASKFGDRFYFETDRREEGFTGAQLDAIRKTTGAHVVCQTTDLKKVPENVFHDVGNKEKCKNLNEQFLDFNLWKQA